MRNINLWLLSLTFGLMPTVVLAHTGVGSASGGWHGFLHPVTGLDHVLAMVSVGMLAQQIGGRALWRVPIAFVSVMAAGGALGMAGLGLPYVETGIAISVMALGALVALGVRLPTMAAMSLVGLFAILHGHAHGAEMPETASGFVYGVGFVVATALLHVLGIAIGMSLRRPVMPLVGGAMSLAGIALLTGYL